MNLLLKGTFDLNISIRSYPRVVAFGEGTIPSRASLIPTEPSSSGTPQPAKVSFPVGIIPWACDWDPGSNVLGVGTSSAVARVDFSTERILTSQSIRCDVWSVRYLTVCYQSTISKMINWTAENTILFIFITTMITDEYSGRRNSKKSVVDV